MNFITKHNALFEWCYVDHLIISHFGYLPQNIIGRSIFAYYNIEDLTIIKEIHENSKFLTFNLKLTYFILKNHEKINFFKLLMFYSD